MFSRTNTTLRPLAFLLLWLACSPSREAQKFARWGLPEDLLEYQNQLESLRLPQATTNLGWLSNNSSLKNLIASGTSISDLHGLPKSLSSLDISYTPVSSLSGLPESIKILNIAGSNITDLHQVP